jgi:hypothetical protein
MPRIKRFQKSRLNTFLSGRLLRLRDGLYRQLRDREWVFGRTEDDLIFLTHRNGAYGVVVRIDDIDWNQFWASAPS